jgi:hypothetical protein
MLLKSTSTHAALACYTTAHYSSGSSCTHRLAKEKCNESTR